MSWLLWINCCSTVCRQFQAPEAVVHSQILNKETVPLPPDFESLSNLHKGKNNEPNVYSNKYEAKLLLFWWRTTRQPVGETQWKGENGKKKQKLWAAVSSTVLTRDSMGFGENFPASTMSRFCRTRRTKPPMAKSPRKPQEKAKMISCHGQTESFTVRHLKVYWIGLIYLRSLWTDSELLVAGSTFSFCSSGLH